jgi:uroporphyrinogen decarboxylase
MDFKQRFLTTMNHEEPDRVPVMGLVLDQATVNQILGRRPIDFTEQLGKPLVGRALRPLMNTEWFWNRSYYGNWRGALAGAIRLGFDANWTIYSHMKLAPGSRESQGFVWHDVFGREWELASDGRGSTTANYTRALCEDEAQWDTWVEAKVRLFERVIAGARAFHEKLVDEYGDRILPIGFAAPGIFENSWQPVGFANFTRFVYEKPDFVRRIVDFHTDFYLRYLEAVMDSGVEVVIGGDDLGQKTGPMLRPSLVEKLYGESYRRVAAAVHQRGKKLIFHSCGRIYEFLDRFVDWGFDGILTMEPTAGMDLARVREQVGHRLVLVGNLDVSRLLVTGTRQEVEEAVKRAIRAAAPGGGYILSAAHSHPHVDAERLQWMVEATHEYGSYPLRV